MHARLSSRWQGHLADFGPRIPGAYAMYPRMRNGGYRIDARPEEGFAGSDIRLVQEQLLDEYDMDYAVLTPMQPQTFGAESPELAAALCSALNDWTREEWLDQDARLLGSICPPHEHPDLAVAEIERLAGDDRFVQVLLPGTLEQGLGNRRYWPMLRAAAEAGLPVALHTGGLRAAEGRGLARVLPRHARAARHDDGGADAVDDLLGPVREIPDLQVVAVETGIAWAASLSWTIDDAWRAFGEAEITRLRRPPSEYLRENWWFTTQPIEEPDDPEHLALRVRRASAWSTGSCSPATTRTGTSTRRSRRSRARSPRRTRRRSSPATPARLGRCAPAPMSDVVVVGAGFAGLYALHRLRGIGLSVVVLEAGDGVGGTWYWNRYPGARCDVESLEYSYSFSEELQQEWEWTERYPAQPEILRYLNHVADRFDLRPRHPASTRASPRRSSTTRRAAGRSAPRRGETHLRAFCVMATGCLSASQVPEIQGLERFEGEWYHTGALAARGRRLHRQARRGDRHRLDRHPVDPRDRRAGGAPDRLPAHGELQRAGANAPMDPEVERTSRPATPSSARRSARVDARRGDPRPASVGAGGLRGGACSAVRRAGAGRRHAAPPARSPICSSTSARTRRRPSSSARRSARPSATRRSRRCSCPHDFPIGAKRLCQSTRATSRRSTATNVTLVDCARRRSRRSRPTGLRDHGRRVRARRLVFATGFDALTGALLASTSAGATG